MKKSYYKRIIKLAILILGVSVFRFSYAASMEQDILDLINQERKMIGVHELRASENLNEVAKLKAQDMIDKEYFAHTSPAGVDPWHWFDQAGYEYKYAGENLAMDFRTARSVVRAWMNSPTHKENILSKNYTEIGIAVMDGVLDGNETKIAVQSFGMPIDEEEYLMTDVQVDEKNKKENEESGDENDAVINNVSIQTLSGDSFDELVVYSEVIGENEGVFVQIDKQEFELTQMGEGKYLGLVSLEGIDLKGKDILIKSLNEKTEHYLKVPKNQYQDLFEGKGGDEGGDYLAMEEGSDELKTGLMLGLKKDAFGGNLNINFQNMIFLIMSIFCVIVIVNIWALEREEEKLLEFCQVKIDDTQSVKG